MARTKVRCPVLFPFYFPLAEKEKGKLSVAVARDAEPGVRWVRLHDEEGATAPRPFVIGVLPEVIEAEPNDDPHGPQSLGGSAVTINGRLASCSNFATALISAADG